MNEVTLLQVKTQWSTLKEFDCIIQTQNCEINTLQEKKILSSHKIKLYLQLYRIDIFLEIHMVYFSFKFDVFFMNTHRCLFN